MVKFKLTTPVLYLAFNRLDSVQKTFPGIQKAKPNRLFIALDGPRTKKEKKKTDAVKKYILDNIDWECEVKTLFRDKNLGCKSAVSGAIDWFFQNVNEGIILEEDCLPDASFFEFCQELLSKYKNNNKITSICGYNYINNREIKDSYYFSRYFECWGWATWKRAWQKCDMKMEDFKKAQSQNKIRNIMPNYFERTMLSDKLNKNVNHSINSWAYPFLFSQLKNNTYSIIPSASLVENLGISEDSTHTKETFIDKRFFNVLTVPVDFPLKHPLRVELNNKLTKRWIGKELKRIILKKLLPWK